MRKVMSFFLMGLSLVLGTAAFAETVSLTDQYINGKLYIEPGTVHIAPNGIFLNLDGNFIPVNGVCVDEKGIYVLGYDCVRMVQCYNPTCMKRYDSDNQSSVCPHGYKVQYPVP